MKRMLIIAALAASSSTAVAQSVNIPVTLTEFKIEMAQDTVKAGSYTFQLNNKGVINHSFFVRGPGVAQGASHEMAAGESGTLTVTLKAGTYELYCPLSDLSHRKGGMTRKLVVTAAAAPAPKKPGA